MNTSSGVPLKRNGSVIDNVLVTPDLIIEMRKSFLKATSKSERK